MASNLEISRRDLALAAVGGAVSLMTGCGPGRTPSKSTKSSRFPQGFKWGAASSAFQTEGSLTSDGRGPSIWDLFSSEPKHIIDGSNASVATDSYVRYQDDVALIADAGLSSYRFSTSWSRVLPSGFGAINEKGLDFYDRFVDALLAHKIDPYLTLFHWDLPQALFKQGGWRSRETPKRLADFAELIARRLGDRVKNFVVLNEAAVHTVFGHVLGIHAPGQRDANLLGPVTHHQNLGQGLAIAALRATRPKAQIGTTLALQPIRPEGGALEFWNLLPETIFDEMWNGAYLDPLLKGVYPWAAHRFVDPFIKQDDMAAIHQDVDFVGVNYYSPTYVKLDSSNPGFIGKADPPAGAKLDAFGREIDPRALGQVLHRLRVEYGNPNVIITENGVSDHLSNTRKSVIDDKFRVDYLSQHLNAVKSAIEQGSKVNGYFVWTLVDNWEWNWGYTAKFGLCAMDRVTGHRQAKNSMSWIRAVAQTNSLPTLVG